MVGQLIAHNGLQLQHQEDEASSRTLSCRAVFCEATDQPVDSTACRPLGALGAVGSSWTLLGLGVLRSGHDDDLERPFQDGEGHLAQLMMPFGWHEARHPNPSHSVPSTQPS